MKTRLHAVNITGIPPAVPSDRPVILAANHVSWFDGFLLREVQRMLRPRAPFHAVMSATELERFPFFRWLGVVGIDRTQPTSVARAIHALERAVAERPD